MTIAFEIMADLGLALMFGGMVFFAVVVAPATVSALAAEQAAIFGRTMFPRYYTFMTGAGGLAAVGRAETADWPLVVVAVVTVGFVYARQVLMPAINDAHDKGLAGDADAQARFAQLHKRSVAINALQMLATLAVFLHPAFAG